jgi:hypothetical protein
VTTTGSSQTSMVLQWAWSSSYHSIFWSLVGSCTDLDCCSDFKVTQRGKAGVDANILSLFRNILK